LLQNSCRSKSAETKAMPKKRKKQKPRRNLASKEACLEILLLARLLKKRCDVSKVKITCKGVIESHYVLADDGTYINKYGGRKDHG
jgi:hypothetical protein